MVKRSRLEMLLDHEERRTRLHGRVPAQGFPTVVRKGGVRAGGREGQPGSRDGEQRRTELARASFPE